MDDLSPFLGGVLSDAIDGGRSGAEIELRSGAIQARTPEGQTFSIPFRACRLELGGASGRMIFCHDESGGLTVFCEDRRFPTALELESGGVLSDQLDRVRGKRRSERRRSRTVAIAVVVLLAGLLFGGYHAVVLAARAAIAALPISVDRQIGDKVMSTMDLGGPPISDDLVVSAIQSIVDRLKPHASVEGFDYRIQVVDAPILNAFALPGGSIVVYTGLLEAAEGPEQVAGVLAHEISHVTLRHGLKGVAQSLGVVLGVRTLLGDVEGLVALGAGLLSEGVISSHSRAQEAEADAEGVRMMLGAEIDPRALAGFFELLHAKSGDTPGLIAWLSSHPQHEDRIAAIETQIADLGAPISRPLDIDWEEVQRRIGGQVKDRNE
ncbi:MAG: M48 family metallopeptidase [Planctomycetota bacterium]|nr:M48 family metallopeptidase [Planctomycetota bacterium]